jgi:hypothetical protein
VDAPGEEKEARDISDIENARAAIDAYTKICRAALGKLCSPAFQSPSAFSARQQEELIKKPFAERECKFVSRV